MPPKNSTSASKGIAPVRRVLPRRITPPCSNRPGLNLDTNLAHLGIITPARRETSAQEARSSPNDHVPVPELLWVRYDVGTRTREFSRDCCIPVPKYPAYGKPFENKLFNRYAGLATGTTFAYVPTRNCCEFCQTFILPRRTRKFCKPCMAVWPPTRTQDLLCKCKAVFCSVHIRGISPDNMKTCPSSNTNSKNTPTGDHSK